MKGQRFIPLLVVAAGLLAYHNSFTGAFVHDDVHSILENPTIRRLWPIWQPLSPPSENAWTVSGRPLINLSVAVNYALGGFNVWGYHALNLTVHILVGLTLFGIVRRTLFRMAESRDVVPRVQVAAQPREATLPRPTRLTWQRSPTATENESAKGRDAVSRVHGQRSPTNGRPRWNADDATLLALATAVLWIVHPLQTEAVTYIIQRAESIMGLFYLLTLYCFIRGVESVPVQSPVGTRCPASDWPRGSAALPSTLWIVLSVTACALGMASKEVMVSAPVMVLLYDRAFLSGSFREAWQRRWPLYLALAGSWALLDIVLGAAGNFATTSMIAQQHGRTWWQYLATQPGVILYYLRLSVWPSPLCVCHPWPIARTWMTIYPAAAVIALLLGASVWAWTRKPASFQAGLPWGFAGAWFFLILAPSSSFIPLLDPMYEHRLYLPLAAVVSLAVMALYAVVGRRSLIVFGVVAVGLGILTWQRNLDYQSEITLWSDAVTKFPNDSELHYKLGVALAGMDRVPEAIKEFEQSLRLKPDHVQAHYNLGVALVHVGRTQEAMEHWEQALRFQPDFVAAHYNLGVALEQAGHTQEAIAHYEAALRLKADFAKAQQRLTRLRAAQ